MAPPVLSFHTGFLLTVVGCSVATLCFVFMLRQLRHVHPGSAGTALSTFGAFGRNVLSAYRRLHPASIVPNVYRLGVLLALLGLACAALSSPTIASA